MKGYGYNWNRRGGNYGQESSWIQDGLDQLNNKDQKNYHNFNMVPLERASFFNGWGSQMGNTSSLGYNSDYASG